MLFGLLVGFGIGNILCHRRPCCDRRREFDGCGCGCERRCPFDEFHCPRRHHHEHIHYGDGCGGGRYWDR